MIGKEYNFNEIANMYGYNIRKEDKDNMDVFGLKSTDDPEMLSVLLRLDKALRGELDKQYNLSNGDQVTYHWDTSKLDVLEEKYNAKFILEDKTFTVSGLKPFS